MLLPTIASTSVSTCQNYATFVNVYQVCADHHLADLILCFIRCKCKHLWGQQLERSFINSLLRVCRFINSLFFKFQNNNEICIQFLEDLTSIFWVVIEHFNHCTMSLSAKGNYLLIFAKYYDKYIRLRRSLRNLRKRVHNGLQTTLWCT